MPEPLLTDHLIISLHKQAAMIHENRTGAKLRLRPESLQRLREARGWLTKIIEAERPR